MREAKYTSDDVRYIASKCGTRMEMRKAGIYYYAAKYNMLDECRDIIDKNFQDELQDAIKQCTSITELRRRFPKFSWYAATHAEEIKYKFPIQRVSIPQRICNVILDYMTGLTGISNTRKHLLSGRELDIFYPEINLACEYNGFYWHASPDIQTADVNKDVECESSEIVLLRVSEPANAEYSLFDTAVQGIKEQLIAHIDTINTLTSREITDQDVRDLEITFEEVVGFTYNIDRIDEYIERCTSYAEFRKKHNALYQYLLNNNRIHLLDPLKCRDHRHMTEMQYIDYIVSECSSYTDFLHHKTYSFAYARGYAPKIKLKFNPANS